MSAADVVLVAAGAAVGAPLRYILDRAVQRRTPGTFPWGTLTVNVAGSFVLGVVAATSSAAVALLVGTGFCGALTTFSTFGYESERLVALGSVRAAVGNVAGSLVAGVLAAAAGWWLGTR